MSDRPTTKEVAAYFGKSVKTILRWVQLGLIRPMHHCKPYQFTRNEITRRENQLKPIEMY